MKRKYLVSYWLQGEPSPTSHEFVVEPTVSNLRLPLELQRLAAQWESQWPDEGEYAECMITLINFWEII